MTGGGVASKDDRVAYRLGFANKQGEQQAVYLHVIPADQAPPAPPAPAPTTAPDPGEFGGAACPGDDPSWRTGTLYRWMKDLGHGLIKPADGGDDVFCHSASLVGGAGSVAEGDQ